MMENNAKSNERFKVMCSWPQRIIHRRAHEVGRIALPLSVAVLAMSTLPSQATGNEDASGMSVTFFVSPNGNDNWSGRHPAPNGKGTDGPFATPARAQVAVRRALRSGERKPIQVAVRGGKY